MLFDLLILVMIALLALAVLSKDLLPSAVSLASASIVASIIFYMFNAMWVAVFELTVVAGLITVLFISAISLTKDLREDFENHKAAFYFPLFLIIISIAAVLGVSAFGSSMPDKTLSLSGGLDEFRHLFWIERKFDILGQGAVILTGVFGIAAFFRRKLPADQGSVLDEILTKEAEHKHEEEALHG